jgi:hypothetical protein
VISFRYHLVSIIAVFLALALGIVVGTTALSGPITKDLRRQLNDTKHQRDDLNTQAKALQGQVDDAGQFATTYGAQVVANQLTNQKVIEIVLPGATDAMQSGVTSQLKSAGAGITGVVTVTKAYLDSGQASGIKSLATSNVHPASQTLPETSDPGKLGGALLAYVLLGHGQPTDLTTVLGAFTELHMISVAGGAVQPATNMVVIGKGAPSTSFGGSMELSLVDALVQQKGHIVVGGDAASAGTGGLIGLVRASGTDRELVSTVDNADSAFGQVSTVLALSSALKNTIGQYGTQNGADALYPTPKS